MTLPYLPSVSWLSKLIEWRNSSVSGIPIFNDLISSISSFVRLPSNVMYIFRIEKYAKPILTFFMRISCMYNTLYNYMHVMTVTYIILFIM